MDTTKQVAMEEQYLGLIVATSLRTTASLVVTLLGRMAVVCLLHGEAASPWVTASLLTTWLLIREESYLYLMIVRSM